MSGTARADHSADCQRLMRMNVGHLDDCECPCHSPFVKSAEDALSHVLAANAEHVMQLEARLVEVKELYGNALDALSAAEDDARAEERRRCINLVCELCAQDWPREGDWHRHPKGEDMDGWSLECHAMTIHDASAPPLPAEK